MSVLIKGMQLPDMCGHCRFATAFECEVTKNFITTFNVRQADCPLISVPKHGRLGDLDELKVKIKKEDNAYGFDSYGDGMYDAFQSVYQCIDAAPTVIPASERKE